MSTNDSTLNFVVAHSLEAAAVIEKYGLKAVMEKGPFVRYEAPNINLVVAGMGRVNAAAATAYLAAVTRRECINDAIWINAGIAGHRTLPLGESVIVHKITEVQTGVAFYPLPVPTGLCSTELLTVDVPESDYSYEAAYDMEGSAFWSVARKFSPLEFIQLVKVVSDNPSNGVATLNKQRIDEYMRQLANKLDDVVKQLQELACRHNAAQSLPEIFEKLSCQYKFTVTQKRQLQRACQRFAATGIDEELEKFASEMFPSAKELLRKMNSRLDRLEL